MASGYLRFYVPVNVVNGIMMWVVLRFELFMKGSMIVDIVCLVTLSAYITSEKIMYFKSDGMYQCASNNKM